MTSRWPGRPTRESVRTIAAAYAKGDRICLDRCLDHGVVTEVRCEAGRIQYRADWEGQTDNGRWFDEDYLRDTEGDND